MSDTFSSVFVNSDWFPKSLYLLLIRKLENIINTDEILFHYCLTFKLFSNMGTFGVQYARPLVLAEWELVRDVERHVWEDTFWGFWSKKNKLHYVLEGHLSEYFKISTNSQFLPSKFSVYIRHGEAFIDKLGP